MRKYGLFKDFAGISQSILSFDFRTKMLIKRCEEIVLPFTI